MFVGEMLWDGTRWKPCDPPWSSTEREGGQLGCSALSWRHSGMKGSLDFPLQLQLPVSPGGGMMSQEPQQDLGKTE